MDVQVLSVVDGCFALVNLSGMKIFGVEHTNKKSIEKAEMNRVLIIRHLCYLISKCQEKPKMVLTSSSILFYGSSTRHMNEESTEFNSHGDDFWGHGLAIIEAEAKNISIKHGVPVVQLRFGLVISAESLELKSQFSLLSTKIGNGKQWISWIHLEDTVDIIIFLLQMVKKDKWSAYDLSGGVNVTCPKPVQQKEFAKALCEELGKNYVSHTPAWLLKWHTGKLSTIFRKSHQVLPIRLSELGFRFRFTSLNASLKKEFGNKQEIIIACREST